MDLGQRRAFELALEAPGQGPAVDTDLRGDVADANVVVGMGSDPGLGPGHQGVAFAVAGGAGTGGDGSRFEVAMRR